MPPSSTLIFLSPSSAEMTTKMEESETKMSHNRYSFRSIEKPFLKQSRSFLFSFIAFVDVLCISSAGWQYHKTWKYATLLLLCCCYCYSFPLTLDIFQHRIVVPTCKIWQHIEWSSYREYFCKFYCKRTNNHNVKWWNIVSYR